MNRSNVTALLAVSLLFSAAPLLAQSAPGSTEVQLQEQSYNGIPFVTGGVGVEERSQMDEQMRDYNLKLIFALEEGNYVSNVDVTVTDAADKTVLQTTTNGPWLAARLPEGTYHVRATRGGETLEKDVEVSGPRLEEVAVLYR